MATGGLGFRVQGLGFGVVRVPCGLYFGVGGGGWLRNLEIFLFRLWGASCGLSVPLCLGSGVQKWKPTAQMVDYRPLSALFKTISLV